MKKENELRSSAAAHFLTIETLKLLEADFKELNVPFMPIKGAHLATCGLLRRPMADIDIVVKPADYTRVIDYFKHTRALLLCVSDMPHEQSFRYPVAKAAVVLDIHRLLSLPGRFFLDIDSLFRRGTKSVGMQTSPSAEDALLITLCHALVHISKGWKNTVFDDIDLLVRNNSLRWDLFWATARSTGIVPWIVLLLSIYIKRYASGIPIPQKPVQTRIGLYFCHDGDLSRCSNLVRSFFLEPLFVRSIAALIAGKLFRLAGVDN